MESSFILCRFVFVFVCLSKSGKVERTRRLFATLFLALYIYI